MSLARVKTWIAAEVLFASDLNAEFNSVLNNALALISPLTGNLDGGGYNLTNLGLLTLTTDAPATPAADTLYADTIVKVWAQIDISGGTPSISDDVNVSSVTDNAVGDITLNLATAFSASTANAWAGISHGNDSTIVSKNGVAAASARIRLFSDAGAAVDISFTAIGVGRQ